jgi:hypothetical protein
MMPAVSKSARAEDAVLLLQVAGIAKWYWEFRFVLLFALGVVGTVTATANGASAQSNDTTLRVEAKIPLGEVRGRIDHMAADIDPLCRQWWRRVAAAIPRPVRAGLTVGFMLPFGRPDHKR